MPRAERDAIERRLNPRVRIVAVDVDEDPSDAEAIAFIAADGKIINIEDMKPQTEDNHCAKVPARYALEMNVGWFAQRGIKPGMKLGGIDKAPRPH